MYPDERVARFVTDHFLPVRIHAREQREDFKRLGERYGAQWTPTLLVLDPSGTERYRVEGFQPAEDVLAHLHLGLGHSAFQRQDWKQAEKWFRDVLDRFPNADVAPEAQYWAGVTRYKATNDGAALADTARAFQKRFTDTPWARKASVWAP